MSFFEINEYEKLLSFENKQANQSRWSYQCQRWELQDPNQFEKHGQILNSLEMPHTLY